MEKEEFEPQELTLVRPHLLPSVVRTALPVVLAVAAVACGAHHVHTWAPTRGTRTSGLAVSEPEPSGAPLTQTVQAAHLAATVRSPLVEVDECGQPIPPRWVGGMGPLPHEQLAEPIEIAECALLIDEWRGTPGFCETTRPSPKAVRVVRETCTLAVGTFQKFMKAKGFQVPVGAERPVLRLSMMPAMMDRHGGDARNLNDDAGRFLTRTKEFADDGQVWPIWGYFQRSTNRIYLRNDVLTDDGKVNREYRSALVHEVFHALSYAAGIFDMHPGDKDAADEKLAEAFTASLGLGP